MSCNGCTGKCCAVFHFTRAHNEWDDVSALRDGELLKSILVPLTQEEGDARAAKFGFHATCVGNLYMCNKWDEDTGLCTIYDERPEMCKDYPYARGCAHQGCGYESPGFIIEKYKESEVSELAPSEG